MDRRAIPFLLALPRMLPPLLRHVSAYAELAEVDARAAAAAASRRLLFAAIALLAGQIAALLGVLWLLIAVWDTPYRTITAAILFGAFVLLAIVTAVAAARRSAEPAFANVRAEWERDRQLLETFVSQFEHPGADNGAANPYPPHEDEAQFYE